MSSEERIRSLEEEAAQLERVARLSEAMLAELMKSTPPPVNLEQVRHFLRSAKDLLKHGEQDTAQELMQKAEEALHAVRQWLAVGDLGISPFLLRNHLEKNRLNGELQRALILYFLRKQPHAENDRDKLDYLLSAYFLAAEPAPEKIATMVAEFFAELPPRELQPAAQMMLHELQSLAARIQDFTDFDQLVHARIVERARALKINLGEGFYDPDALPTIIRFNLAFRGHFEKLLHKPVRLEVADGPAKDRLEYNGSDGRRPAVRPVSQTSGGRAVAAVLRRAVPERRPGPVDRRRLPGTRRPGTRT